MNDPHATQVPKPSPAAADPGAARRRTWLHVGILALLCAVMFFYRARSLPLADPDESRCALIVRNMFRTGDWVVPRLEGKRYYSKPAPFFWLAAVGQKATGSAELGGRAVAALSGILAVLATYFFARRIFGAKAGLTAGIVLATTGQFLFYARWFRMDMPFAAAMWAALWFFRRSEAPPGEETTRRGRFGWYGFYAFCAVATLFKGPAGLLLPALIVGSYLLLSGRPRRVFELLHVGGILLYLLIAAPWYAAISLREPGYAHEFLIRQNIERFTGNVVDPHGFVGLVYILVLLAGLLPWTACLPGVCIRYFPRRWRLRARRPGVLLMWLAVIVPLVFFGLSKTKMAHYILPVFPPLAVLTGGFIADWMRSSGQQSLHRAGAAALFVTATMVALLPAAVETWLGNADLWLLLPTAVGAAAVFGIWLSLRRGNRAACVGWTSAAVVAMFVFVIAHTAPVGYEQMSTRSLAQKVDPATVPSAKFFYWTRKAMSFQYYTGAAKAERLQHYWGGVKKDLAQRLASDETVYYLVTGSDRLADVRLACPEGFTILWQSGQRWVVTNPRRSAGKD